MSIVLEVRDLRVRYGKVEALSACNLQVAAGQIVTVIGPNGAGKSSMLNAIMGALPVNASAEGEIRFQGGGVGGLRPEERVRSGMSLVPETRELFGSMSIEDNLKLGAYPRKLAGARHYLDQLATVYALFPRLEQRRAQMASTLSGGERQMLAVGRALMAKPSLLMLDEPSLGLAPRITQEILRIIGELRKTGVATLLIEQNARAALQLADYGYVLETGAMVMDGPSRELAGNPRVLETYLGSGMAGAIAPAAAAG